MITLLFHPTEELKLINFQKELIADLNTKTQIFYGQTPLFINLPFLNSQTNYDLKQISKSITQITLSNPIQKEKDIIIPVKISTNEQTFFSNLFLLHQLKGEVTELGNYLNKKKSPVENLKIFRLGIINKISNNTFEIEKIAWKKL